MTAQHDQMKNFILDQFKGKEMELIKKFPFLIEYVKTNITAEMRDYIIENSPVHAQYIPSCFISVEAQERYVINMLKSKHGTSYIKQISQSPLSYSSVVLLMLSGTFSYKNVEHFSEREHFKFLRAVTKLFRRKNMVNRNVLYELSYKYGTDILDYYKNLKRNLTRSEMKNLLQVFKNIEDSYHVSPEEVIEYSKKYYELIDEIFNSFPMNIIQSNHKILYNYLHERAMTDENVLNLILRDHGVTTYSDFKSKKYSAYGNYKNPLGYIMYKEKIIENVILRDGVHTLYATGEYKRQLIENILRIFTFGKYNQKTFQSYINSVS